MKNTNRKYFLVAPLFVFQWLFDEAQMRADSVGAPVTKKQWDYIHETGIALRGSLDNVTAVFAPSCIGHAVLTKREWLNIKIDDISLPEALRCWEQSTGRNGGGGGGGGGGNKELSRRASEGGRKMKQRRRRRKMNEQQRTRKQQEKQQRTRKQQQKQQERQERQRHANERHQKKRNKQQKNNQRTVPSTTALTTAFQRIERSPLMSKEGGGGKQHRGGFGGGGGGNNNGQSKNKKRKNATNNNEQQHHNRNSHKRRQQPTISDPTRCTATLRWLERCSWPQCNHSCPSITNPLTGKEMRFLELLASFGLDIEAVANALGVDMPTLSNMDRSELLNLLTQTS